jgi:hypothetical protein
MLEISREAAIEEATGESKVIEQWKKQYNELYCQHLSYSERLMCSVIANFIFGLLAFAFFIHAFHCPTFHDQTTRTPPVSNEQTVMPPVSNPPPGPLPPPPGPIPPPSD